MVNHKCPNCMKDFKRKVDLKYHIEKKKYPCVNSSNLTNNDFNIKNDNIDTDNNDQEQKYEEKDNKENNKEDINIVPLNIYSCDYCTLAFKRKDNLKRHMDYRCKVKMLQKQEKETIFELLLEKEKEIKHRDEQIDKLTKIVSELNNKIESCLEKAMTKNINKGIINNHNHNNIIIPINNFGSENLDNIDPTKFLKSLNQSGVNGLLSCFDDIFNNDPKNKTVYIADKSRNKVMTWQDNKWRLNSVTKTIITIMEQIEKYLEINKQKIENGKLKIKNDPDGKILLNKFEKNLYKYVRLYNGDDEDASNKKMEEFYDYMNSNLKDALCNIKEEVLSNYEKIKAEIELESQKLIEEEYE